MRPDNDLSNEPGIRSSRTALSDSMPIYINASMVKNLARRTGANPEGAIVNPLKVMVFVLIWSSELMAASVMALMQVMA
jgi:hypothetical protein